MEFPALQDIIGSAVSEYEREFIRTEYGCGLPYYLNRLDRMMFSGGHVLDAGCGVGQWSIALSRRFEQVESIDSNEGRRCVLNRVVDLLGLHNIRIRHGSIEQLPYQNREFDAIFCYGVIMFTEVEKTLAEFFRVVRPGGRLYVCLNADGWSQYLIEERGRGDHAARRAGQTTLYSTYWWRAIQSGLIPSLHQKLSILRSVTGRVPLVDLLLGGLRWGARQLRWNRGAHSIARILLQHSKGGTELWEAVQRSCGEEFARTLLDDVWEVLEDPKVPARIARARAYQPHEFESLALAAGFDDFQWAVEGGLVCDWLRAPVEPRYAGTFGDDLAVWEGLFVRPDPQYLAVSVEQHLQAAQRARDTRLYQGATASPILSNRSRWTYPRPLLEQAEHLSKKLGGDRYMRVLARAVTDGAQNEEDAVQRLIRFVQRAVFRDPVSQPLTDTATLPDPLTALLCARGRCGHTSHILIDLCKHAGFKARVRQFPQHIIAEVNVGNRWVIADADAFKNGVIPVNREGRLLSLDDLCRNPYQLDRFPATGWCLPPESSFTRGAFGQPIVGYVDALHPDQRGFVSGYYVPEATGYPPSLPAIVRFEAKEGRFRLEWTVASVRGDRLMGYRVRVGTRSRGWSYDDPGDENEILQTTSSEVLCLETRGTSAEGEVPLDATKLFASVVAFSSRIDKEPETYFWPSEESVCRL